MGLDAISVSDGRLLLSVRLVSFREFFATHLRNMSAVLRFGSEQFADAIGTSVLPTTADGLLALGRRGPHVIHHAGWLHPFGGMVEPGDERTGRGIDVFGAAGRELIEETGISEDSSGKWRLVGLVRDRALWQPELLFTCDLDLTATELAQAMSGRAKDLEHSAIEFVPTEPAAVADVLRSAERITPVAQACLLLHGRTRWGAAWYENACAGYDAATPERVG